VELEEDDTIVPMGPEKTSGVDVPTAEQQGEEVEGEGGEGETEDAETTDSDDDDDLDATIDKILG